MGKPAYIVFRMFGAGCCGSCIAHSHPLTMIEAEEYDRELREMKDKDKVKKYLRGISDDDICGNCSMSRHMHSTTTKNTCNGFVAGKGMTSHDGEARKDGWDE